jgi:pimeloyl-ACP methyl ester carboxylesterase
LASIQSSVLALQGLNDEYGTLEQIHGIAKVLPTAQVLTLPQCGHSPHRDQPEQVIAACQTFFQPGDTP